MRGLPFDATLNDIRLFFSDYKIVNDSVKIGKNTNNRPSGEAAILF